MESYEEVMRLLTIRSEDEHDEEPVRIRMMGTSLQGDPVVMGHILCKGDVNFTIKMYKMPEGGYKVLHTLGSASHLMGSGIENFPTLDEALTYFCNQMDGKKAEGFIVMEGKDAGLESMTVMIQERHLIKGGLECRLYFYEEGADYVISSRYCFG
jgi:hypothetical protein